MRRTIKILLRTLRTLAQPVETAKRLHQLFVTQQNFDVRWKSVSAALLIIPWSSVQVRHALPLHMCFAQGLRFLALGKCCEAKALSLSGACSNCVANAHKSK